MGLFPILRSGFLASYPILPARQNPVIYIDGPIFEGNSGGPIFYETIASSWNNRAVNQSGKIIGLISIYKSKPAIRKIDQDTIPREHDLFIGGFVNSCLILELFESVRHK